MARRLLLTTSDPAPQAAAAAAAADGTGGGDALPPSSPHVQWGLRGSAVKAAIAGNVVVAVLFFAAVIWRIFFSGRGGQDDADGAGDAAPRGRGDEAASSSGASTPSSSSSSCASPRAGGLGKDDLLALPVFVHAAGGAGEGNNTNNKVECAVCICELRDGDTGRLLPACGHRFHAECVDRWFRSHVTCPLCRAVVADGGSGKARPKVQQEQVV